MSLRIRRLQISLATQAGPFGVQMKFEGRSRPGWRS